ncbi:MAG TPA: Holliday junction resolvase Hjc [Candidatus Nanoarchaeia archaeon]|nr:Holliday junction resolvase Hjc [Candidatus Nanoarchaeia archaeon]
MSRKSKGINAERDLVHKFWANNWASVRIAGSGSMRYPSADIIATNKVRKLAIECKATKDTSKYIDKEDIDQLRQFAELFAAEPYIAIKFAKREWFFLTLEDMEETDKSLMIDIEKAQIKGILFEELIK